MSAQRGSVNVEAVVRLCISDLRRYGAGVWIWVALCVGVLVPYVLTTSTFHALVRPQYRN